MTVRTTTLATLLALAAAGPAQAEAGDWLIRLRAIVVAPNETSTGVAPTFATSTVSVTDSFAPEIDFTYFATNNVAFELIAATTRHKVNGEAALAQVGKLASLWVLPPTLTAQYHFAPGGKVDPYLGAGLNYSLFYDEKTSSQLNTAIGVTTVNLKNSAGFALQAGMDVALSPRMVLNFDVKYIDMDTTATLRTGALTNTVGVKLNPIVAGVGIGMRF